MSDYFYSFEFACTMHVAEHKWWAFGTIFRNLYALSNEENQ